MVHGSFLLRLLLYLDLEHILSSALSGFFVQSKSSGSVVHLPLIHLLVITELVALKGRATGHSVYSGGGCSVVFGIKYLHAAAPLIIFGANAGSHHGGSPRRHATGTTGTIDIC